MSRTGQPRGVVNLRLKYPSRYLRNAAKIINNGIVLIDSIENLNADPGTSRAEALVEGTVSPKAGYT